MGSRKKLPKIAVLLAAYNGMRWIEQQINSIMNQSGVDISLYISVDSSTDGTEEYVKNLSSQYSNVYMLSYGERYGGAAPNFFRLINEVSFDSYEYVAFSDQDDIWLEEKLLRAFSIIKKYGCDAYSSDVIAFWPDGKETLVKKSYPQTKYDHFFEAGGPGCSYLLKSSVVNDFKSFYKSRKEEVANIELHDWFLYAYCRARGCSWYIDSKPMMLYRQHENNQVGTNTGMKAFRARIKLMKSGWYKNQVNLIVRLVSKKDSSLFLSRYFLIKNWNQLRRKPLEKIALLCFILFGLF